MNEDTRLRIEQLVGRPLAAESGDRGTLAGLTDHDIADLRLLRGWMIGAISYVRFRVASVHLQDAIVFCDCIVNEGLGKPAALKRLTRSSV